MRFTKMHGLGNDYVYVNCFEERVSNPAQLARMISDRHRGVGSDGLILICPSDRADVRMEMYNADGSRAQMCGNGIRCVAKYAYEHGLIRDASGPAGSVSPVLLATIVSRTREADGGLSGCGPRRAERIVSMAVESDAGVKALGLVVVDDHVERVCVDMGRPSLAPSDLPCTLDGDSIVDREVAIGDRAYHMTCVSVGNPHAVIFVDDLRNVELETEGRRIENAPLFPQRINVHFVRVNSRSDLTMITWERGSGVTQACGTGATAVCVAGSVTKRSERKTIIHLPGGELHLNWASDDHVYMTGPAVEVFSGEWPT